MQNIRLFSTQIDALGQAKTPIVYYIKNFPKPMFVGTDFGETCNIVIDEEVGSAGIKPRELRIGNIVCYNSMTNSFKDVKRSDFNRSYGTPIAIVVIPKEISPSGKDYCISLNNMDASNAKEGTADNLFDGPVPTVIGTYTNSKGVVKENEKVDTGTDTYTIFKFDGWNGRVDKTYVKQVTDFENKLIGDVALKRYEVSSQCRTKFTPSRANAVTRKFNKVISVGNESGTTLLPAPSGQQSVKGYIPQMYYNPDYTYENNDHYEGGFRDSTYTLHYWYKSCVEGSTKKLRIPSPITSDFSFNTKWLTEGSLTADFDGKRNTAELVADAKNGVYDVENGNLIKWDGTAKSLWAPYKVSKYTTVCKIGYDKNGTAYNESNYNKITDQELKDSVEIYLFPSDYYYQSGSLQSYWNYAALTCHCYAPTGSGTNPGDWYCPASGEAAFALAFAKEINDSIDLLVSRGYKAVCLKRPTDKNESTWSSTYNNGNNPYFRGNEYGKDILLTSTAYDDKWMVDMYMGHASFYARSANQASATRAFIQI